MKETMMKRLTSLILIIIGTASLSACGLRSDLERPEPMWGNPQDAEQPAAAPADPPGR